VVGGHADLLRQAFRMTNESYAEYLSVSVRPGADFAVIDATALASREPLLHGAPTVTLCLRDGEANPPKAATPAPCTQHHAAPCTALPN
jgi:hypothetical protein